MCQTQYPYSNSSYNYGYNYGYSFMPPLPSFPPMDHGFSPYGGPYHGNGYGHDCCRRGEGDWKEYVDDRKERSRDREKLKSNRLDLNNDGKFQTGVDGRIVFDWDKDGKISEKDIDKSKDAFARYDDLWDEDEDSKDAPDIKQFDANKDGKLDSKELKDAGASIWVDKDEDGERGRGEIFEADDIDSRYRKDLKLEINVKTGNASTEANDEEE